MSFKREVLVYDKESKQMVSVYRDSSEPIHYVQDDTMPLTQHPVDGQWYNSKSAIRRVTKAAGLVEAGGPLPRTGPPQKEIKKEQIVEAFKFAKDHLRDQTNLRQYRERHRDTLGKLRETGVVE